MGFQRDTVKRPTRRGAVFFLAAATLAGACAEKPAPPAPGAPAPPFDLLDLDERPHGLSDFAGQVVVLNFWATWCPPCVEEMPSLQRLQDLLGDDGLEVVAVSVDERYSDIPPFVAEHGLRFLVLHDLGKRVSRRYEVFQFPETWIIRRDGTLAAHIIGARDWAAPASLEIFRDLLE
ncbi:MAG: TlpA family protein disulfide reductase [Acidobacteria bacterium]|nr:TlpA disulfide reductase family protein [Acidobacteriota bacterium]MXW72361.1 TlpA family protein disulfide reductase [Acidobacteriota bacterium]MYE44500.1 TlpA family protein disulfide reductase [Acidobacteriota bacterium]